MQNQKDKQFFIYSIIGLGGLILIKKIYDMATKKKVDPNFLTDHFTWSEFESKDGAKMPPDVKENIKELAKNLEVIRAAAGKPIKINSGYRSPAHNSEVGGKTFSQHMLGRAADFVISGMTTKEIHSLVESLIKQGKIKQGGLGLYSSWIHYDTRGTKARW